MKKYKRNYLTSVIARLDFAIPPAEIDRELPADLVSRITERFPIPADPVDCLRRALAMRPPAGNLEVAGTERWKRWDFYTKARDRFVRIERDFFCIEYKRYRSFRTLKADFRAVTKWMAESFPESTYRRLGLRYVDTFTFPDEGNPLDWGRWINKKLLVALAVPPSKERKFISRTMQNLELNYGDMQVRFQYGIPNPDYPSPVKQKQFVFDTDVYYTGLLEPVEISTKLDDFHRKVKELFEAHITDQMREHLNATRAK